MIDTSQTNHNQVGTSAMGQGPILITPREELILPGESWESQLVNDKVSIIAKFPQITVGGRLSYF